MISFRQKGDFSKLNNYLERLRRFNCTSILDKYGKRGVAALSAATPTESGKTAGSWYYEISGRKDAVKITFLNSNVNKGVPIAIILQLGHGTGTGGWVEGRDYINPAIQPVFDNIADEAWREVTKL